MTTGLLLQKPCWDLGSTATPRARALAIEPDRLEGVEVKDQDLTAPGNIEPAVIVVRIDIIDPAGAHGLGRFNNLVGV